MEIERDPEQALKLLNELRKNHQNQGIKLLGLITRGKDSYVIWFPRQIPTFCLEGLLGIISAVASAKNLGAKNVIVLFAPWKEDRWVSANPEKLLTAFIPYEESNKIILKKIAQPNSKKTLGEIIVDGIDEKVIETTMGHLFNALDVEMPKLPNSGMSIIDFHKHFSEPLYKEFIDILSKKFKINIQTIWLSIKDLFERLGIDTESIMRNNGNLGEILYEKIIGPLVSTGKVIYIESDAPSNLLEKTGLNKFPAGHTIAFDELKDCTLYGIPISYVASTPYLVDINAVIKVAEWVANSKKLLSAEEIFRRYWELADKNKEIINVVKPPDATVTVSAYKKGYGDSDFLVEVRNFPIKFGVYYPNSRNSGQRDDTGMPFERHKVPLPYILKILFPEKANSPGEIRFTPPGKWEGFEWKEVEVKRTVTIENILHLVLVSKRRNGSIKQHFIIYKDGEGYVAKKVRNTNVEGDSNHECTHTLHVENPSNIQVWTFGNYAIIVPKSNFVV